jgi:uncharacterized protein (TIGR04145 family)
MKKIINNLLFLTTSFVLGFSIISNSKVYAESSAGINIDGYYDDWEDKPMSMITWNNNNGVAYHDVSMVKDDDYIYIFLGMHASYHSGIPLSAINLSINNQLCQLFIGYANNQNTTDWGRTVDVHKKGLYTDLHPFTYYPNNALGDAAITVYNGNERDKLEIRINIRELEKVMGLAEGTVNNGSTISLNMPNVGAQTIQLVGTSSGPYVGIAISAGVVGLVLWVRRKKIVRS